MTADEAREHLKQAIDPGTIAAMALSAGAAGLITRKVMQRNAKRRSIDELIRRAIQIADKYKGEAKMAASHEENRKKLHKLVRPIARTLPYKTKGAKGWDVMADAVLSDDPGTSATK